MILVGLIMFNLFFSCQFVIYYLIFLNLLNK